MSKRQQSDYRAENTYYFIDMCVFDVNFECSYYVTL